MIRSKTPKKVFKKQLSKEKDPVEVFCRLRPINNESVSCARVQDNVTLVLIPPESSQSVKNGVITKEVQNKFKYVFNEVTTQKNLFNNVALPLVDDVLKGRNALLFAYGVTSSGKTHTMTGSSQDPGILPRCLDVIFNSLFDYQAKKFIFKSDKMNGFEVQTDADAMLERQQRDIMPRLLKSNYNECTSASKAGRVRDLQKIVDVDEDNVFAVFVSYIEIYNNYIYDLLEELPYDPITGTKPPTSKILREDSCRNMYVSTGVEIEVTNSDEAYDLFIKGQNRRRVAHTALNTESSRSHSVFSIRVVQAPLNPNGEEVMQNKERICVSQLALVDLAGSERTLRTNNQGDRLKEAGCINQSLMVLRNCIEILRENQKNNSARMVPYRDSRLTHLFKNYFDGEGRVRMIVCVNPSAAEYDETIQVMKFAEMTQEVQVSRPTGPNFQLTPGRRKIYDQQIKYLPALEKEDGLSSFIFNPVFPKLMLLDSGDDKLLSNLILFLKERERKRASLLIEIASKEEAFRNHLILIETDRNALEHRIRELQEECTYKSAENEKLRKRLATLESNNQVLLVKTNMYERECQDLERQEQRQRRLEQETVAQLNAKHQKLELVRNIINGGDTDIPSTPLCAPRLKPVPIQKFGTTKVYPAKSETDLLNLESNGRTGQTPFKSQMKLAAPYTVQPAAKKMMPRINGRPRSPPPPIKPKPSINLKLHRRSRSSGDIWVDHQPKGTQPLNTLVQPKKKKVPTATLR